MRIILGRIDRSHEPILDDTFSNDFDHLFLIQISASVFRLALEHIQNVTGLLRSKDEDLIVQAASSGELDLYSAAIYLLKKVRETSTD